MTKKVNKEYLKSLPVIGKILHNVHDLVVQIKLAKQRFPVYRKETKKALNRLCDMKPLSNRVFFCAVPIHNNLGDQAQAYCIRKWLTEHYSDYDVCEFVAWPFYNKQFQKKFERLVCKENLFVIQSGYCTYERHYNHKVHRYLVDTFKENRIVIMPQTVNFRKEKEAFKTGRIYEKHPRLLFLSRDKKSDEYAHRFFGKTKIKLYPDIVTSLIGTMHWNLHRDGVIICVRNDGEKLYTNQQISVLRNRFSAKHIATKVIDTNYPDDVVDYSGAFISCFNEKLKELASAKVVITDRYHGTIFSMITNTPVIVLATRDHKVKTGTEWFVGVYDESYHNADDLDSAYEIASDILARGQEVNNSSYFKHEFYDKLPAIINEL